MLILLLTLTLAGCGGDDEDAKSESKTDAKTTAAKTTQEQDPKQNTGSKPGAESTFDGTVLAVKLDVPAILQQVKLQLDKGKDPNLMMAAGMVGMVEGLELETITAYLHQIDEATVYPVVIFKDSSGKLLEKIKANPFVGGFLTADGEDDRIAWEKTSAAEDVPEQFKTLRIRQLDDAVAVGVPAILDALKNKSWTPDASLTNELAKPLENSLVSISLALPAKPHEWLAAWAQDDSLSNPEFKDLTDSMFQASQGMSLAATQIAPLKGVALGISVDEEQTFGLAGVIASHSPELVQQIQAILNDPPKDLPGPVVGILTSDLIQRNVTVDGNNLQWSLSWDAEGQKRLVTKMVGPMMMSMFMRGGRSQSPPAEGPITPQYDDPPIFADNVDPEKLKADLAQHLKSAIFLSYGFRNNRMQLEVDPFVIPNSEMMTATYDIVEFKDKDGNDLLGEQDEFRNLRCFSPGAGPGNVVIKAKPGTTADQLTTATIKVTAKLPIVQIFNATLDNIDEAQTKGGVTVELSRIERNLVNASISRELPLPDRKELRFVQPQIITAFDSEGRCLKSDGWSRSGDQVEASFHGEVASVQFGVVEEYIDVETEIEVDLNGGQEMKLPEEPADNIATRYEWKEKTEYKTTDPAALEGLKVEWVEADSEFKSGLRLALPASANRYRATWELMWLNQDGPFLITGHSSNIKTGGIGWFAGKLEQLKSANAVVGQLQIHVATDIETITIEAKDGSDWKEFKLADGQSAFLKIDKQVVAWSIPNDVTLLSRDAYSADGRRLRGQFQAKYIKLKEQKASGRSSSSWGYPQKFELVLSRTAISKLYPIEIVKRELTPEQLDKLKSQAEQVKQAAKTVQQIAKVRNSTFDAPDDIAGLYYLYPNDKEAPGKLISEEIANACSKDAERYGFEAKPYLGYHFELLDKKYEDDKIVEMKRKDESKSRKWANGEIEFKPYSGSVTIVARPVDPKLPTLLFTYAVYAKNTNGKVPEAMPKDLYQWPVITLVDPDSKPRF